MCQELMQGQSVKQRGQRSGQRLRCGQDGATTAVLSSKKTSLLAVLAPGCAFGGEALCWPC